MNAYYFIDPSSNNNLAVSELDEIINYSNDWLYLINRPIEDLINIQKFIINKKVNSLIINEDVIPFITTFCSSVHSFCGIYSIILNYVKNINNYKNLKIIVYKNLQKGVLDLILYLCDIGIIDINNIIYIESNIIYKFDSITIIPNRLHSYFEDIEIRDNIINLIEEYILSNSILLTNKYKINLYYKNISIFKYAENAVTTLFGIVNYDSAYNYSKKNNYEMIELLNMNEIQIIQIINNCENIVFSWGSAYMKNFIYISDLCKTVTVFIIGEEFIYEYNHLISRNILVRKFKNAEFIYKIVDSNLIEI